MVDARATPGPAAATIRKILIPGPGVTHPLANTAPFKSIWLSPVSSRGVEDFRYQHIFQDRARTRNSPEYKLFEGLKTRQDFASVIQWPHTLTETAGGTWDLRDVHRNNGRCRWILTKPHGFHRFGSDGNLEESGTCSCHSDPSHQFERGQVQNSLANGVVRLSSGNSFGDES